MRSCELGGASLRRQHSPVGVPRPKVGLPPSCPSVEQSALQDATWDDLTRERFANDEATLAVVNSAFIGSRQARGQEAWLSPKIVVCEYLAAWVAVKAKWGLTVDTDEHITLAASIEGPCGDAAVHPAESITGHLLVNTGTN